MKTAVGKTLKLQARPRALWTGLPRCSAATGSHPAWFTPRWHAAATPNAPHLSEKGRVWCKVELEGVRRYPRPESQGGEWLLADRLKVLEVLG